MSLQLFETSGRQLAVTGTGAIKGEEIIGAEFVYGALGTCQSATLRTRSAPDHLGRSALWQFKLGTDDVFRGIVDTANDPPGELAQIGLLGPHRQTLGGLGEGMTGQVFGIPTSTTQAQPHEVWEEVLNKILQPYPNADYGERPDGVRVMGLAEFASPAEFAVDERAFRVTPLGVTFPDYVTDVVFDPGENWKKYTYKRNPPDFVVRRTAAASAKPTTVLQPYPVVWERKVYNMSSSLRQINNTIIADGVERSYAGNLAGTSPIREYGWYGADLPADNDEARAAPCKVRCPYTLTGLEHSPDATNFSDPLLTVTLLHGTSGAIGSFTAALKKEHVGMALTADFDVPKEIMAQGSGFKLEYNLDNFSTFQQVKLIVSPILTEYNREVPNTVGLEMPPGWTAPYVTEPRYEVRVPGWHIPPLRVSGLPGGRTQMAAGTTVVWNGKEASTLITTAAWPFSGQQRSG